jgi:M6 family metalloprotease-like protein
MATARIWAIASGVAALALVASVGQPASAAPEGSAHASVQVLDIQECKPTVQANGGSGEWPHLVQLSFAPLPDRLPSSGEVNVTAIFVDFSDAPAQVSTASYFRQFIPDGLKIIEDLSYGQVSFTIDGPHGWFRMPRPSGDYGYFRGMDAEAHRGLIADAVKVSDSAVDYSRTDAFIIVMPPAMANPGYGVSPAFLADDNFGVPADGNILKNGTTIGTDWPQQRPLVVAHELLHTMGLVDLYKMNSTPPLNSDVGEYVGTYSIMSVYGDSPPPLFAWERWVRGWLRDDQVTCLGLGIHDIALGSIVNPSRGQAMSVVPLGGTRYLSIEARGPVGKQRVTRQGVIPYIVDPSIPTGEGPIRVPQRQPGQPMSPLATGATVAVEGIGVEVRSARNGLFNIRIHNPVPPATSPGAPGSVKVTRVFSGSVISWAEPLNTGWSAVTGYEVRWNGGSWQTTSQRSLPVQRGQAGKPLTFEVRALNAVGPGPIASIRVPGR